MRWTALIPTVLFALACGGADEPVRPEREARGRKARPPVERPASDAKVGRADPSRSNLIIVVLDDVGTDKVSAYREHPNTPPTPNLDALAASGVLFRNAYGYPTCSPTRAAVLTGRYGRRNGFGGIVDLEEEDFELPLAEVTLPEMLGSSWDSAAIGKWHLSGYHTTNGARHPNLQGFGYFAGSLGNLVAVDLPNTRKGHGYSYWEKCVQGSCAMSNTYATVDTTDEAIGQMAKLDPPWVLYVAYNAVHTPVQPPPAALVDAPVTKESPRIDQYNASLTALDRELGRLLAAMSDEARAATNIVVLGDNGTDREFILPPRDPDDGKVSLKEGGTNIPLLVAGPWVKRPGEAAALVHVVDLLPTIAEATQTPLPSYPIDGVSFLDVLADPSAPGQRRFVYTEKFKPIGAGPYTLDERAVRDARWKLISGKGGEALYDLQGRSDDGPPVTPVGEAAAARERLRAELARIGAGLAYAY